MKITKDMVGKKVRKCDGPSNYYEILVYVGQNYFITKHSCIEADYCSRIDDSYKWELYEEPKKKKIVRMAPALIKIFGSYRFADWMFASEQEAKDY